jgi:hypothetical protein
MKTDYISLEIVEELKYLGTTLTNQNYVKLEIKKGLNFGIFATIRCRMLSYIVPDVLFVCETWSLTLRKTRSMRVFENRVLRGIFWPKVYIVMGE